MSAEAVADGEASEAVADEPDGGPPAGGEDAAPAPVVDRPDVPVDLGQVDPTELGRATRRAVARALAEDLGDRGDVTSLATVPPGRTGRGVIVARAPGVVFGVEVVLHVFEQVDTRVDLEIHVEDGQRVRAGEVLITLTGPLSSILTGERVALNFLGHLSGIATQVRRYVDAAGPGVAVRDTRKTTPGLRLLEKAAVRGGGGHNHRVGLYDALLIKDNHVVAAGGITEAVEAAFERGHGRHVQVEVTTLSELEDAIAAGAIDILLDNFDPEGVELAVQRTRGRAALEASGSVSLENIAEYASTGVDRIAVGRLTHSTTWLDVALDLRSADAAAPRPATALWSSDATVQEAPPAAGGAEVGDTGTGGGDAVATHDAAAQAGDAEPDATDDQPEEPTDTVATVSAEAAEEPAGEDADVPPEGEAGTVAAAGADEIVEAAATEDAAADAAADEPAPATEDVDAAPERDDPSDLDTSQGPSEGEDGDVETGSEELTEAADDEEEPSLGVVAEDQAPSEPSLSELADELEAVAAEEADAVGASLAVDEDAPRADDDPADVAEAAPDGPRIEEASDIASGVDAAATDDDGDGGDGPEGVVAVEDAEAVDADVEDAAEGGDAGVTGVIETTGDDDEVVVADDAADQPVVGDSLFAWRDRAVRAPDGGPA